MQSLRQRGQSLDAIGAIEERWRPGHEEVKSRKPAGLHLIHELAQRIQTLIAYVPTYSLQGLYLIQYQNQSRMT